MNRNIKIYPSTATSSISTKIARQKRIAMLQNIKYPTIIIILNQCDYTKGNETEIN